MVAAPPTLADPPYSNCGEAHADDRYNIPSDDPAYREELDPTARSLLQVTIEDSQEEGEIFEKLMGDVVEPRREFIQDNALNVANLDV